VLPRKHFRVDSNRHGDECRPYRFGVVPPPRPGRNVTGLSTIAVELAGKRLSCLGGDPRQKGLLCSQIWVVLQCLSMASDRGYGTIWG
jgi:hypothetical protein